MLFRCCGATCGFERTSTSEDTPAVAFSKDQNAKPKSTDSEHKSIPTAEPSFAGASATSHSKTILSGEHSKSGHAGGTSGHSDAANITTNHSGEVHSSSQKGSNDALLIAAGSSAAGMIASSPRVSLIAEASGTMNGNSGSLPMPQHTALRQGSSMTAIGNSPRSVGGGTMSPKELFSDITHLVFLGAGAYGSVYEGMWHGAVVAIKFIKSDTLDSRSASAREATFSNMLAHPHVVQTFWSRSAQLDEEFIDNSLKEHMQQRSSAHAVNSFVSNEGFGDPNRIDNGKERTVVTTYSVLHALSAKAGQYITAIAMEYMDNCSLHEVVAQGLFQANSKWGPRIVLRALSRTAREVARGMWHLHSSGVIHGDLKPANVLLKHSRADRRGFVCKVSDFGLSRESVESERLVSAETWGTVSYMAPEHFQGAPMPSQRCVLVRRDAPGDVHSGAPLQEFPLWSNHDGRAVRPAAPAVAARRAGALGQPEPALHGIQRVGQAHLRRHHRGAEQHGDGAAHGGVQPADQPGGGGVHRQCTQPRLEPDQAQHATTPATNRRLERAELQVRPGDQSIHQQRPVKRRRHLACYRLLARHRRLQRLQRDGGRRRQRHPHGPRQVGRLQQEPAAAAAAAGAVVHVMCGIGGTQMRRDRERHACCIGPFRVARLQ